MHGCIEWRALRSCQCENIVQSDVANCYTPNAAEQERVRKKWASKTPATEQLTLTNFIAGDKLRIINHDKTEIIKLLDCFLLCNVGPLCGGEASAA